MICIPASKSFLGSCQSGTKSLLLVWVIPVPVQCSRHIAHTRRKPPPLDRREYVIVKGLGLGMVRVLENFEHLEHYQDFVS